MAAKKIIFVTGTRADFGKLEPLAVAAAHSGFDVSFFVTGMHMMEAYGTTKIEVHRTPNVSVYEFLNQRPDDPQDTIFAKTMIGFSDFLQEHKPDLVLVHGDRVEAMACALVCATNYVRCAHIEGGEVSGTIDEVFRHCNTKLAYCHFVSSETASKRVQALGEDVDSIYVIGSPELDFHAKPSGITLDDVIERYHIENRDYGICTFHPVTSEADDMRRQAENLFGVLEKSGKYFVVIKPNNDPGSEGIIEVINNLPRDRFRILPSMRFAHFSELMKNAACMIGNSSAGVREAPFVGITSLDIGSRQTNRSFAASIFKAHADERSKIAEFLNTQWGVSYSGQTEFGQGDATEQFISVLKSDDFWSRSFQKRFHDVAE